MLDLDSLRFGMAAFFFATVATVSGYHLVVGIWAGLVRRRIIRRARGRYDTGWAAVRQGLLRVFIGLFGLGLVSGALLFWWFRVRPPS